MAGLPFRALDVLIVDEMGKNVSGTGLDTNVVGRGVDGHPRADRTLDVGTLWVRALTPESRGNAVGIGLADLASTRLVEAIDPAATFTNALYSLHPAMAKVPMHFRADAECLRAALQLSGADPARARVARVRNTLALDRLVVSEACLDELSGKSGLDVVSPPRPWAFTAEGDLHPVSQLFSEDVA
jgi:hypothetical protein